MIERKEIERFLNQYVGIGVPHDIIAGKLFFYFGKLKSVDGLEVKIETKNGIKIISLGEIRDLYLAGGNHGY